jgi:hypothetical protein
MQLKAPLSSCSGIGRRNEDGGPLWWVQKPEAFHAPTVVASCLGCGIEERYSTRKVSCLTWVATIATATRNRAVHEEIVIAMRALFEALVADSGTWTHAARSAAVCYVTLAPYPSTHVGLGAVLLLHSLNVVLWTLCIAG